MAFHLISAVSLSEQRNQLYLTVLSRQTLVVTLFLVGAGLTKEVLMKVGLRPLAQGVTLWIFVSVISLGVILKGWVH